MNNRLANCHNRFQDAEAFPRVLCVCSAGLLRSPTIAWVLSNEPYSCNVRAAGAVSEYALVPVDAVLLEWAEHMVLAQSVHLEPVEKQLKECAFPPKVWELNVPDQFSFRDPDLVKAIKKELERVGFPKNENVQQRV